MLARSIQCYLLCFVRVFQQSNRNVLSNVLVLMTNELGLTISQKGTLLAMIPLGYFLTQVPGGALADRIGAKNVMRSPSPRAAASRCRRPTKRAEFTACTAYSC